MATAFAAAEIDIDELIDLDQYPIHELSSSQRKELVSEAHSQMTGSGCFCFPGFIRPDSVEQMRLEATALRPHTFWSQMDHNPYFNDDESLPPSHPRRAFQERRTGFINSDVLTATSVLRRLYDCDVLMHSSGSAWAQPNLSIGGPILWAATLTE